MNKYDFPTTEEYTKQDVAAVQAKLLEMAKIVTKIFEENNIKYMLAFGSLLGAVRHKGFIPWDDDLDFFILEDDYNAAIKCLEVNIPDWIIIQNMETDANYSACWTKLRDRNTTMYSEKFISENLFNFRGIHLDLFGVFNVPKKDVECAILKENIEYYHRKRKVPGAMTEEQFQEKMKFLLPEYEEAQKRRSNCDDNTETFAFVSIYRQNYYPKEWIFPLKKYDFEDVSFYGPQDADSVLSVIYGDYMSIPPYEKRKTHYKWVKKIND